MNKDFSESWISNACGSRIYQEKIKHRHLDLNSTASKRKKGTESGSSEECDPFPSSIKKTDSDRKSQDSLDYQLVMQLHIMWKRYIEETLSNSKINAIECVLKSDLHGCHVKIVRSSCPSFVGRSGFVLVENMNSFVLIRRKCDTELSERIIVPKAKNVFELDILGQKYHIYGDHLLCRTADRSSKKWKAKDTVEI